MKHDVVGRNPGVGQSPLIESLTQVLEHLSDEAETIDRAGVTREHIAALSAGGFFLATAPSRLGGSGASAVEIRESVELLAAASGSVWFVATQHRAPAEAAAATTNQAVADEWAQPLASGDALGAVSFAHLRRSGLPQVRATAEGDGWRFDGRLDWVTSWGLADVLLLMAETRDGHVVQAMLPAKKTRGLVITGGLPLAAMSGTSTVSAEVKALRVDPERVACVIDKPTWAAEDSQRTANASPAVFGLLRATLSELEEIGQYRGAPEAVSLAHRWAARAREIRSRAYALIDAVAPDERMQDRVLLRAESLHLAQEATAALVVAHGGKAMLSTSSAQRWAREALFYLIQAQTLPLRQNLLALYNRPD